MGFNDMEIIGDPWKNSTRKINKQEARLTVIEQCVEGEKLKQGVDECFEKYGCEKESALPNGVERLRDICFISYLF